MLRRQIDQIPETLQDFELASEQRYWDGAGLIAQGRALGGVYLLGYSVEMILKHSCFRTNRGRPADAVGGFFGPAKAWMKQHEVSIGPESYHSLWFWMMYLRGRRRELGRPLPQELDWSLVRRVRRLYQCWSVELRYRPWIVSADVAKAVYDDATWMRDHRIRLWS
jgi:hypothetical protein